jgi:hypothetical protein
MIFDSVSLYFANLRRIKRCKTCVSGLNALFLGTNVVMHPFYTIGPRMMFGCVSKYFANLQHIKDAKLVFEPEWTISGYQSCESSIQSIGPKMMFGSASEHFANLRLVKRCKTTVSGLNAPFPSTNVVKHPFYSNGTRMMFGCVSKHFAKIRRAKRYKTSVRAWMHYFEIPKLWSNSRLLYPKWCLRVFQSILLTFGA